MARPPAPAPACAWSSLLEHVLKAKLYSLFFIHAVRSARRSGALLSYSANVAIALLALRAIISEVALMIKRVQRRLPPGYIGFPVVRDVRFLRGAIGGDGHRMRGLWEEGRQKYGNMFASWNIFGRIQIALCGQDDLTFLFNCDRKGQTEPCWPKNVAMLLGPEALINQSGKYHRTLRRLMEPSFAPKFVTNYLTSMDETTMRELAAWSSSGDFQSSEVFKMYALKLFFTASFGRLDEDIIVALHDDFKIWQGGFLALTTRRIPGTAFDEGMKARERLRETVNKLIDKFAEENPETSERAQTTIIGCLVHGKDKENNRTMTRNEIIDNLLTVIFAGHDTTNASISTIIYHLSQNDEARRALVEELATLSEPLKAEELKGAPVLNACIHESWRVDPPIVGGFRKTVKEVRHKGYLFDRGTIFNYSIWMASSDRDLYVNHDGFDMTRFLPTNHPLYRAETSASVDPVQGRAGYPIFGGGTHACLGKSFAVLEMRVLIARIYRHYDVEVRNARKRPFPFNRWEIEFRLTSIAAEQSDGVL